MTIYQYARMLIDGTNQYDLDGHIAKNVKAAIPNKDCSVDCYDMTADFDFSAGLDAQEQSDLDDVVANYRTSRGGTAGVAFAAKHGVEAYDQHGNLVSETWYADDALTMKVSEKTISYNAKGSAELGGTYTEYTQWGGIADQRSWSYETEKVGSLTYVRKRRQ